ncbi:DUF7847 domain-containing protein [Halorussus halobius]|uniref:DUF7847 domain-containing protein n=1 Tax=Halorussus halobius TaxID=1710537 RepID=UPI00109238E0|nr:hypothetical protein [Halorussus halobius]
MGAISAFSTAVGALRRNAVLLGVAFAAALANVAVTGVTLVLPPSVAALASVTASGAALVVAPLFVGGLLAMAHEGLDGPTGLATFTAGGRANYLPILGAMVLLGVLVVALGVAVSVAVLLVVGLLASTDAGVSGLALSALVGLVGVLASSLILFVVQFYAPAIVVSDLEVGAAFQRSADLVRENPVSTLGYTAVLVVLGGVTGVAGVAVAVAGGAYESAEPMAPATPELGVGVLGVLVAVSVAVTTVVAALAPTYQVAFYADCLDEA